MQSCGSRADHLLYCVAAEECVWECGWIIYTYTFVLICMCVCPCIILVNYIRIPRGAANVGHLQWSTLKIKTILMPNSRHYSKSPVAFTLACSHLDTTHEDSLFLAFTRLIFVRFLVHCYSTQQSAECSYAHNCNLKRFIIISPVMCVAAWCCIGLWVLSNCLWAHSSTVLIQCRHMDSASELNHSKTFINQYVYTVVLWNDTL